MLTAIVLRDREVAGLTRHELLALEYLLHERFSEVARTRTFRRLGARCPRSARPTTSRRCSATSAKARRPTCYGRWPSRRWAAWRSTGARSSPSLTAAYAA